jgi:hypothetical protein
MTATKEGNMMNRFGKISPAIGLIIAVAAVSACTKKAPETFTGDAEVGKTCVESAAAAYGVSLNYITLNPLTADPSGSYAYAYQGIASESSGVEKTSLCRLDENKRYVDIVTWVPKK